MPRSAETPLPVLRNSALCLKSGDSTPNQGSPVQPAFVETNSTMYKRFRIVRYSHGIRSNRFLRMLFTKTTFQEDGTDGSQGTGVATSLCWCICPRKPIPLRDILSGAHIGIAREGWPVRTKLLGRAFAHSIQSVQSDSLQ
jgi:hypothetical protein